MSWKRITGIGVLACLLMILTAGSAALAGMPGWQLMAGPQDGRIGAAVECVSGDLYVFGGYDALGAPNGGLTATETYDAQNHTWVSMADMNVGRYYCASAVVGPYIFAFGGFAAHSAETLTCERYDIEADTWTPIADLPRNRHGGGATVWMGRVYLFGGLDGASPVLPVDVYDPLTDTWAAVSETDVPSQAILTRVVTIGKKAYLYNGYAANLWSYDFVAKTWDTSLPGPTNVCGAEGIAGTASRIYLVGGRLYDSMRPSLQSVESWAPGEASWRAEASLNVSRDHVSAVAWQDAIYTVGGLDGLNGAIQHSAEKLPATTADFDDDGDVDLADFGVFSSCFNGPNRAPVAGCP